MLYFPVQKYDTIYWKLIPSLGHGTSTTKASTLNVKQICRSFSSINGGTVLGFKEQKSVHSIRQPKKHIISVKSVLVDTHMTGASASSPRENPHSGSSSDSYHKPFQVCIKLTSIPKTIRLTR